MIIHSNTVSHGQKEIRGGRYMCQTHPWLDGAILHHAVWTDYTAQLKPLIRKHQDAMQMTPDAGAKPRNWIERLSDSEALLSDSEALLSEHLETMKRKKSAPPPPRSMRP